MDGGHIKSLLLTFFYRYMKPLVDNGYVYVANPPLFRIQDGKKVTYAYSDKEKEIILDKSKAPNVQRYKGLGEMNPEQLWETTMDPATRVLFRIKILDNYKTEETFINLMGENTEYRKAFIQKNGGKINIGEDI